MHRLLVTIPHLGEGEFLQQSGVRTPGMKRRNREREREREIRELSQEMHMIHEKRGSMCVKRLVYETISTKET